MRSFCWLYLSNIFFLFFSISCLSLWAYSSFIFIFSISAFSYSICFFSSSFSFSFLWSYSSSYSFFLSSSLVSYLIFLSTSSIWSFSIIYLRKYNSFWAYSQSSAFSSSYRLRGSVPGMSTMNILLVPKVSRSKCMSSILSVMGLPFK